MAAIAGNMTKDCHDWCTRILHWFHIPERVSYKLCLLTHRCLLGKAPVYMSDYWHQCPKLLHDSTYV